MGVLRARALPTKCFGFLKLSEKASIVMTLIYTSEKQDHLSDDNNDNTIGYSVYC